MEAFARVTLIAAAGSLGPRAVMGESLYLAVTQGTDIIVRFRLDASQSFAWLDILNTYITLQSTLSFGSSLKLAAALAPTNLLKSLYASPDSVEQVKLGF